MKRIAILTAGGDTPALNATIHGAEVNPRLVAEFLLLNEDFPRSVRFCIGELNVALRRISGVAEDRFCNDAEKLAGRLVAELQFSTIDEIFEAGLHDYLDLLQLKFNNIGAAMFNTYIFQPFSTLEEEIMVQQEEQQQQEGKLIKNEKFKIKKDASIVTPVF